MPDVKIEDGSENFKFFIVDLPVVRPKEEPIAIPLEQIGDNDYYVDRCKCSTC